MSRVFITGSSEGLGLMAARLLADDGHSVTLHARSAARAEDARAALPAARAVVVGDLSSIAGMRQVAGQANAGGPYDAVIHNAGVGYREPRRIRTDDGLEHVFAINVLAPYLLTGLIERPGRLVYLSSGMHRGGDPGLTPGGQVGQLVVQADGGPGPVPPPAVGPGADHVGPVHDDGDPGVGPSVSGPGAAALGHRPAPSRSTLLDRR